MIDDIYYSQQNFSETSVAFIATDMADNHELGFNSVQEM